MTPLQALQCGTINGARYLGLDADLGSIEPGKLADLVVFTPGADPTKHIRDSEKIHMTIANGRIFESATMTELDGKNSPAFFWHYADNGISYPIPIVTGCSCGRSNN